MSHAIFMVKTWRGPDDRLGIQNMYSTFAKAHEVALALKKQYPDDPILLITMYVDAPWNEGNDEYIRVN